MKKKLLTLLVPITICVLGIIIMQVDWMFKTYADEKNKVNVTVDLALHNALKKFKHEQRTADSIGLTRDLKKLVDTVHLKYSANGDSLSIRLQNYHSWKVVDGVPNTITFGWFVGNNVSISSPTIVWARDDKEKQRLSNDETSKLEHDVRNIVSAYDKADNISYDDINKNFKADSNKIIGYVKAELSRLHLGDAYNKTARVFFAATQPINMPKYHSARAVPYQPNALHLFNKQKWVGVYFVGNWTMTQIVVKAGLSILMVLTLVFSFINLIKIVLTQKQLADIKDDFIDNLTHEFKTPIATISAAVEGLQKFNALDDKEKTARYLEISKNELNRLNDMVTKLLNIAVHDKNNLNLTLHRVDVAALVDEVVGMEQFRAVKPVQFVTDIDDSARYIQADPVHFKNVIVNLVDNAVKYSKQSVTINISGLKENNMACFRVRDNGLGIPATMIKNVFDKFFRVPSGDNIKGSGLGLSYVRSVIEAHGGTISAKSELNTSTEFIILIPLK